MERPAAVVKITEWIKKYRYVLLILVIGILFMVFPVKSKSDERTAESQTVTSLHQQTDISEELAQILSQIQGVGKVKVMLTVSVGEKTIYQEDSDISTNEDSSSIQKDTVIITNSDRSEQPLISHVMSPTYLGAIIVCQGADQASVKIAVLDAVSKITGLTAEKISVVKMK